MSATDRPKPRVLVEIVGGCINAVFSDCEATVTVVDYDNVEAGDSGWYEEQSMSMDQVSDETLAIINAPVKQGEG